MVTMLVSRSPQGFSLGCSALEVQWIGQDPSRVKKAVPVILAAMWHMCCCNDFWLSFTFSETYFLIVQCLGKSLIFVLLSLVQELQLVLAWVDHCCPIQGECFSRLYSVSCNLHVASVSSATPPARPGRDTCPSAQRTILPIAKLNPDLNKWASCIP